MKYSLAIIAGIFLLGACGGPQKGQLTSAPEQDKRTATAFVMWHLENGNPVITTQSVTYRSFTMMKGDLPQKTVMQIAVRQGDGKEQVALTTFWVTPDSLKRQSHIEARGRFKGFTDNSQSIVTIASTSNRSIYTTHQLFSLISDKSIIAGSGNVATLTHPGTATKRYAAFLSVRSGLPLPVTDTAGVAGVLTYAAKDGPKAQWLLRCYDSRLLQKIRQFPPAVFYLVERQGNTIRTADMELFPPANEPLSTVPDNFMIELNFGKIREVENITIPVSMDSLLMPTLSDNRLTLEPITADHR